MGLISRVSSRTYRKIYTKKFTKKKIKIKMFRRHLLKISKASLSANSANKNLPIINQSISSNLFKNYSNQNKIVQTSSRTLFGKKKEVEPEIKSKFSNPNSNKAKAEAASKDKETEEEVNTESNAEYEAQQQADEENPWKAEEKSSNSAELDQLKKELEELKSKLAQEEDTKDKFMRAYSEQKDANKRAQKKKEEDMKYAAQKFAKDILTVHDELSYISKYTPKALIEEHQAIKDTVDGVNMTLSKLEKTFNNHHMFRIEASQGTKFDEKTGHEAVSLLPPGTIPNVEPGCIGDETKSGWKIHDRILRSAQVIVIQE